VFWDESGASLLPVTRRTWAPRGHTPVIRHRFKWKRASMAAGLCYGSRGGGASVAFHHQLGAYDTNTLIGALEGLRRFLGGQKATLLWDGLPAHRSHAMAAWLRRQRPWLVVAPLPGYAPELNPVEALWANLKGVELANSPATPSTRSPPRPSAASSGSGAPTTWPSRSCATAICPSGEHRPCHRNERTSLGEARSRPKLPADLGRHHQVR
jgi:DDE superfamily endonuclease